MGELYRIVIFSFFLWECGGTVIVKSGADNICSDDRICSMSANNGSNQQNEVFELFDLWRKFSVFSMENVSNISSSCSKQVEHFIKAVGNNEINALKMFDATGKLPSGLLRGNVNQFGDFDECLSVDKAKYCLAEIDLESNWRSPYSKYKHLVHSHYAIKETFDDVKHRVPGFSMIRWGFCIPDECTATDLEKALLEKNVIVSRIKPTMCQTRHTVQKIENSLGYKITIFLISSLVLITFVATMNGIYQEKELYLQREVENLLECFDIRKNWKLLTNVKESDQEVKILHGIRALSALALLISHKTMALFYNPYINRSVMTANLGMRWSVIGRTAIIYTDCFMLISGFLNSNSLFKDLDKKHKMMFGDKLISRIFRITPNIVAVILFCTYILPSFDSGPLWPLVVGYHSNLCKKYMWRNFFYIHNYFPFQDMCLTHTHQVGIDMQLFLSTPLIVYVLWSSKKLGLWVLGIITLISTILRSVVTWNNNLSHVVHFGITIKRMFDTANLSYILPTHRATIYFMGVYLSYLLRNKSELHLSKIKLTLFWTIFMSFGFGMWLGPVHMSHMEYQYNRFDAILYAAFSPILWGAAVAWTVYATEKGMVDFLELFYRGINSDILLKSLMLCTLSNFHYSFIM
ncbi:hypothetical protein WA026_005581 [Henosepilachna vigintioctopunctata]|uniref:Nose resistant-to-fluoxetine protein N-terminal domain-containing protein n=1 Tax=Henosepilachna vigintioctopunctata TaxID=420089 RepID=A0AAW1TVG5_9CUCU